MCKKQKLEQKEAEERAAEAEKALARERSTRAKLIADEGRRDFHIPYEAKCRELKETKDEYDKERKKSARFAKLVKVLEAEKSARVHIISDLKAEKAGLAASVASWARTDAVRRRSAKTAAYESQRRLARLQGAATEKVAVAKQRAEAAEHALAVANERRRLEVKEAEVRAEEAEEWAHACMEEAIDSRDEAMTEVEIAIDEKDDAVYAEMLARKREVRAKAAAEKLAAKLADEVRMPVSRTDAEWAELKADARWKAAQRDRDYLEYVFKTHHFRMQEVSDVLGKMGLLERLMDSPAMFAVFFNRVEELKVKLEREEFGIPFGLVLHYDFGLTPAKILSVTQVACKKFHRETHNHKSKALLHNPYLKDTFVKVPRIAPPMSKLVPIIRSIEEKCGISYSENGRIAYKTFSDIVQVMLMQDPGTHDMPEVPAILGGDVKLPIIIKYDATGFGQLQLTTLALHNPYMPQAAQQLRIMGLGRVGDDRLGVARLIGPNLDPINDAICNGCIDVEIDGESRRIEVDMFVTTDVSALRHSEHLANAGSRHPTHPAARPRAPPTPHHTIPLPLPPPLPTPPG